MRTILLYPKGGMQFADSRKKCGSVWEGRTAPLTARELLIDAQT